MIFRHTKQSILVIATLLATSLSSCLDTTTDQDRAFMSSISKNLRNHGDVVSVGVVHAGDWTRVCSVIENDRVSRNAGKLLGIDQSDVEIVNTNDEVASIDQWGYIFLYPPNRVEYLRVDTLFFTSGADCADKGAAKFKLIQKDGDVPRLKLISEN